MVSSSSAERLVILHTNDTHSQIDPNDKNLGGVVRRMAIVDSVRRAEKNVMLVDAGDAVQGTLYFSLYGGEVERKVMNYMGYDIQILGNHEFDNGVEPLAEQWRQLKATLLTTNYDVRRTALAGLFRPYEIREFAGVKVAFIAINLDPKGMIADKNAVGVTYLDAIKAANATAWYLKHHEYADFVVALTHIGYGGMDRCSDEKLAANSEDIDVIIGGHSHTTINPANPKSVPYRLVNAVGDTIVVTQTGKSGLYVGETTIDLDSRQVDYRLLQVDNRYDNRADKQLESIIAPYRHGVDSVYSIKIGYASKTFDTAEPGLMNWMADFVESDAQRICGTPVDLSIVNKGGIRTNLPQGDITQGRIMQIFPFDNKTVVIELSGADLLDALNVMAGRGGDGVSREVKAVIDGATHKCTGVTISGKPLDETRIYRVATIDYLANGGDYMAPLTKGRVVAESAQVLYDDMIDSFKHGKLHKKKLSPDNTLRMIEQ